MTPDVGERLPKVGELGSLLKTLTPRQLDFIRARLECESDAEAARTAGIHPKLVAKWKAAGAPLDAIVQLAKLDSVEVAIERLRRLVNPALDVFEDELRDKRTRHAAAREILDRAGLVAETKTVVAGDPAAPVKILVEYVRDPAPAPGPASGPERCEGGG